MGDVSENCIPCQIARVRAKAQLVTAQYSLFFARKQEQGDSIHHDGKQAVIIAPHYAHQMEVNQLLSQIPGVTRWVPFDPKGDVPIVFYWDSSNDH